MSNYLESAIGDHLFRASTFSKPSSIYIGLHTSSPSDDDSGTEVSGGSYSRVEITQANNQWNVNNGVYTNTSDIEYPDPTSNWGTITHFGIYDASSGGNLLVWGGLSSSKIVNSGDQKPKFSSGRIQITFK